MSIEYQTAKRGIGQRKCGVLPRSAADNIIMPAHCQPKDDWPDTCSWTAAPQDAVEMGKEQPTLIKDISSDEDQQEFKKRIVELLPEKVSLLFFGFKSVEILLRSDCNIDAAKYDIDKLYKALWISREISLELDVLVEECSFDYSAGVDAILGHDVLDIRSRKISKIGLYVKQGDDVFLITTGHERIVGDKLYLPETLDGQNNPVGNPFAVVVYVTVPGDSTPPPPCDIALAKVNEALAKSVSNYVKVGGRTLQLAPRPGRCEPEVHVQMFTDAVKDYSKRGKIKSKVCEVQKVDSRHGIDDCFTVVDTATDCELHGQGYSGILATDFVEADSPSECQVSGRIILIGVLNVGGTQKRSACRVSVAVPLDRTLKHLEKTANFRNICMLTGNSGGTGSVGSTGLRESNDSERGYCGSAGSDVSSGVNGGTAGGTGLTGHQCNTVARETTCATVCVYNRTWPLAYKVCAYNRTWPLAYKVCVYDCTWPLTESEHSVQQVQPLKRLLPPSASLRMPTNSSPVERTRVYVSSIIYKIQCLPYELHEMLLLSSARQLAKTVLKTDSRPDVETFVTLASVCQHFYTILTKRNWFARTLKQYLTVVCRPYRLCPPLLTTVACQRRAVLGLTKLDNKLYVVYCESDTIDVYTTQSSYTQLSSIHVNGLKTPMNIATCSINSSLYVADIGSGSGGCVWKVTRDHKVGKWLDIQNFVNLSVTSDGHVVMLTAIDVERVSDKVRFYHGRVDVYSAARVKLSIVKLPCDIVNPRHVMQTVNKSFIVCHGDKDTELHRVCEVNNAGVQVKSYGGSCGSGLGQLDWPWHFVLDKDERVIVADYVNQRVLLLDKQLNIQRVLLTWSHDRPLNLFYDRETAQLIVGLNFSKLEMYRLL